MLPRAKRVVLEGSEVEDYKNKSTVGHWVLVRESTEGLRKERHASSKEGRPGGTEIPSDYGARFTAENVIASGTVSLERFMNVSGHGYRHVDGECFAGDPFDRVSTVNADDNRLRLDTFRTFKSVRRLSLRRNHLESVEPFGGDLAETLIRLDVSENRLNPDDVYRLSTSKLEELYVSANNLMAIPESITDCHCFLSLDLLDLSDNYLSCPRMFYVLSTLHNLKVLNLSGNRISFIPYLITKQTRDDEEKETVVCEKDNTVHDSKDWDNEFVCHVMHIPFVSLNTIDLSNNWITENSSVLSLICWPSLTNVTLTANTISLNKNLMEFKNLKSTLSLYNIKINHCAESIARKTFSDKIGNCRSSLEGQVTKNNDSPLCPQEWSSDCWPTHKVVLVLTWTSGIRRLDSVGFPKRLNGSTFLLNHHQNWGEIKLPFENFKKRRRRKHFKRIPYV